MFSMGMLCHFVKISLCLTDCLTLGKSYRGEADFSLFSLHKFMAHFGSILRSKKKKKENISGHNLIENLFDTQTFRQNAFTYHYK